jgi:hypothetical protein
MSMPAFVYRFTKLNILKPELSQINLLVSKDHFMTVVINT